MPEGKQARFRALAEGRGDLVLHHFHAGFVADDLLAVLDGAGLADIEADRRVELERVATRGGFGISVDHAYLLAKLVAAPNVDKRPSRSPYRSVRISDHRERENRAIVNG